jgi:2-methylcitrate dehydratase PrpD
MNTTTLLAAFVQSETSVLPLPERATAVRMLLDSLAVTVAGFPEPGPQAVARALVPSNDDVAVHLPWTTSRYRPDDACLLFGTAAHVLDYDDVSMISICHPSVAVLTALYVLAQQVPITGARFLDAYVVGTEVLIRSGEAMGFRHYDLGFHATGTLGALGAAAACARALGLLEAQTGHALAIAASSSAGLRTNFGTMVKSLHVGLAASAGLRAARFAQAGVAGADDAFGGCGWLYAFSGGEVAQWPAAVTLGKPFVISDPGFEQKRYPCCYMMHKIAQATLELRRAHGLALDGLQSAHVLMPAGGTEPLIHPYPASGLAAKFSGPYAVVGALADGCLTLRSFEDDAVVRPAIQASLRKVDVKEQTDAPAQGSDMGGGPVTVELVYEDGRQFSRTVIAAPGSKDDPLTLDNLLAKWQDCLKRGMPNLPRERARSLFASGLEFDAHADAGRWLAGLNEASMPSSTKQALSATANGTMPQP